MYRESKKERERGGKKERVGVYDGCNAVVLCSNNRGVGGGRGTGKSWICVEGVRRWD